MQIQTQVIARQPQRTRHEDLPRGLACPRFAYIHIVEEATKDKECLSTLLQPTTKVVS
jgi:hypothetical protein